MSTLRFYPTQGTQLAEAFSDLFAAVVRLKESYMQARRERAAMECLVGMDDAMLRDIGLYRTDLGGAQVSTHELEQIAQSRVAAFALHIEGRSGLKPASDPDCRAA